MFTRPDGTLIITVRVTLKPGRDDDLITIVRTAPPRGLAAAIREAMRSGVTSTGDLVADDDDDMTLSDIGMEIV
jgi:hypothetical protein